MTIDYALLDELKPKGYPVKHRHKEKFNPRVSQDFAQRARRIRDLEHELDRFILTASDYFDIVVDAYASNVHWSTKLEGNPLPEAVVKRLTRATFSGEATETPIGPKQEIINHLWTMISPGAYALPWNQSHVCELNKTLLQDTGTQCTIGQYRVKDACIKTSADQIVFIPAPIEHIENEMGFLLDWTNKYAPAFDPIVASTVMFHEFESIHPFEDGNGRTGRTLFHLYLQQNGLPNSNLCKIESQILHNGELYYQLLAYADETNDYSHLIDFVSFCIEDSYNEAIESLRHKDLLSSELDEMSKRILRKAKRVKGWFSVQDTMKWVDNVSVQTIRNRLNILSEMGALYKQGATKSCRYRFNDPLMIVRDNATNKTEQAIQMKIPKLSV